MFRRFPHADTYTNRKGQAKPATIDIRGAPGKERVVVNFNAQIRPGPPSAMQGDSEVDRVDMFQRCLDALARHMAAHVHGPTTVGFPYTIGCGLARGDWERYYDMIKRWAENATTATNDHVLVTIYRLPDVPIIGAPQQTGHAFN